MSDRLSPGTLELTLKDLRWKAVIGIMGIGCASLAQSQVVVNLNGVRVQHGRNETRSSSPNALAPGYLFRSQVDAMVRGRGAIFGSLYSTPEPLATVLEELAPGSSAVLDQTMPNFSGTFPFAVTGQRVEGETEILALQIHYGLTISAGFDAAGITSFSFTDVILTPTYVGYFEITTGTATITRVPGVLAGTLDLDGFTGDASTLKGEFELRDNGGALVEKAALLLDPTGRFVTTFSFRGTAQARVVVPGWLSRSLGSVTVTNDQQGGLNALMINGDIDRDNGVTVFDYDALSRYFDRTSADADWRTPDLSDGIAPFRADLDGDGSVSVFDYDILSRNFDLQGD